MNKIFLKKKKGLHTYTFFEVWKCPLFLLSRENVENINFDYKSRKKLTLFKISYFKISYINNKNGSA